MFPIAFYLIDVTHTVMSSIAYLSVVFLFLILFYLHLKPHYNYVKLPTDEKLARGDLRNFQHPFPYGWYLLFRSDEIKVGQKQAKECLGLKLVVYRGENGQVAILDAICRHLGGNMGVIGKVVKNCLTCTFHGWEYDATGKCVKVPYKDTCETIPSNANVKAYPCREKNRGIYIWYGGDECPNTPQWELHEIPSHYLKRFHGEIAHDTLGHAQEICENSVDIQHFPTVHTNFAYKPFDLLVEHAWTAIPEFKTTHPVLTVKLKQRMRLGRHILGFGKIDVDVVQDGPGNAFLYLTSEVGMIVIIQSVLPVKRNLQLIREIAYTSSILTRLPAKLALYGTSQQLQRDIVIWSSKELLRTPTLMKKEKPIKEFRRWLKQFYPRHLELETEEEKDDIR